MWLLLNTNRLSDICHTRRHRLITKKDRTRLFTSSVHLPTVNCHRLGGISCRRWATEFYLFILRYNDRPSLLHQLLYLKENFPVSAYSSRVMYGKLQMTELSKRAASVGVRSFCGAEYLQQLNV